jgi:hypothetical protein
VGDWRDNKRCGRGVFSWPDGSYYDGEWDSDTRHGKGRLVLAGGFTYDGCWLNNSFDGRGVVVFPSQQRYEGSFKGGMREGRGSITFAEGAVYVFCYTMVLLFCFYVTSLSLSLLFIYCCLLAFSDTTRSLTIIIPLPRSINQSIDNNTHITFVATLTNYRYEGRFREDRLDGQGTIKVTSTVPGAEDGEKLIPIEIQADIRRIHLKAGFGAADSH